MTASSNPSIGSGSKSVQEPNIDFELDIKVFIDSGKCVLHPKDSKDDEQRRLVLRGVVENFFAMSLIIQ